MYRREETEGGGGAVEGASTPDPVSCSFPGELDGRGGADVGVREPEIMDQRWAATRRNGGQ